MSTTEILIRAIQRGKLLGPDTFAFTETGLVLAGRDQPEFERAWLRLFEEVNDLSLPEDDAALLEQLRETAYRTAYDQSLDPELSAYLCDDFEVLAKGVAAGHDSATLAGLLDAYLAGQIPHGEIRRADRTARALLENLGELVSIP